MIIRIEAAGSSFRGAGKYYLHDKAADPDVERHLKPKTDERVWFTDTRNCLNVDPERALDEMWRTAEEQAYLKVVAGVARGGRVCSDPVKTISLSWHKDDAPSPEHMIEAADSFLAHMKWDGHQAVLVAHRDTEHRHIHIILNRVHPETGRTLDDYRDKKRAQSWALQYEKAHEQLRCEQRELNAARREGREPELESRPGPSHDAAPSPDRGRAPANDHLPHNVIAMTRPFENQFEADEQARREQHDAERLLLKAEQRDEREAFFEQGKLLFKATRHAVYDEVRKEFAPEWRAYYAHAREAGLEAEAHSGSAVQRALYFAKRGDWDQAREAYGDRNSVRDAVGRELGELKADLKQRQTKELRSRQRDACDALRDIRDVQYQELLQRQRDERAAFSAGQTLDASGYGAGEQQRDAPAANSNVLPQAVRNAPAPLAVFTPEIAPQPLKDAAEVVATLPVDQSVTPPMPEAKEPSRQLGDMAATAIGGLASFLADQLGEMLAPTPPEVREANAKVQAKAEEAKAERAAEPDPYARHVEAAMKVAAEQEQDRSREEDYWRDRDRAKGWDRDR